MSESAGGTHAPCLMPAGTLRCRSKKIAGIAGVVSLAKLCVDYVPVGRPRGDGREMSIMAIRSFSSYQQWKRLMPGTSIS
jgi:hypothetical protein